MPETFYHCDTGSCCGCADVCPCECPGCNRQTRIHLRELLRDIESEVYGIIGLTPSGRLKELLARSETIRKDI